MNRFQCVADLQRRYGVKRLCRILDVSRSSFYYWRRTAADRAARQAADAKLAARIQAVHQESDGTYGAPRITAELREENGAAVNHKRVARIMRASGIEGVRLRRRHRTTVPDPAAAKAPDLIRRDFTADRPNTKYVGDITYLPIEGGKFCYLATVIDLASRRLAGWAIADHMRADLVTDALAAAVRTRGSPAGSIMHTDHGAQGGFNRSSQHLDAAGTAASIGPVGDAYGNALLEPTIGLFKTEVIKPRRPWKTLSHVELVTAEWVDWYNHRARFVCWFVGPCVTGRGTWQGRSGDVRSRFRPPWRQPPRAVVRSPSGGQRHPAPGTFRRGAVSAVPAPSSGRREHGRHPKARPGRRHHSSGVRRRPARASRARDRLVSRPPGAPGPSLRPGPRR
ncbi:IS3 family transposase [Streptomyces sp. NPDC047973]|uniref:IS3 family transposase n=1 Tax=Streptomyces sp. NPDC047973 TaxID=3155383 RepID=UPI00343932E0